ncbi:MAG: FHA domain-containing protein [Acidobacteria bacterium]|nr:FHA domain-containing protein [Acidobacteriota bacterium]
MSNPSFETQIEEPPELAPAPKAGDFVTRIESPAFPTGDLATRMESPIPTEFVTRIEAPPGRTDDLLGRLPGSNEMRPVSSGSPLPGTELLSDTPPPSLFETKIENAPFNPPAPPPQPPPPQVAPPPLAPPPMPGANLPPAGAPPGGGRHTSVMAAEDVKRAISSKGKLVGWLVNYGRNPDGEDYKLRAGYNRLGANPACDIVVEDETVSGSHAILVFRDGRCLIKDDLSRNGTFVNGKEITEAHPLQNYDQVRVGNTTFTYVAAQQG